MAKVIQNFLIGLGLDTKGFDKADKETKSKLMAYRNVAGAAGAALVGAFSAAGLMALRSASQVDSLYLATEKLDTGAKFVYDYGNALKTLGGNASDAFDAVSAAEMALTNLHISGQFGEFQDAALAGVDTAMLTQARNGEELIRMLSDMVPRLNSEQQRALQAGFGFSDAVMRSLKLGDQGFSERINQAADLTGGIDGVATAAREFNEEMSKLQLRLEGVGNSLAEKVLPGLTEFIKSAGGFIDRNQENIEAVSEIVLSNPTASAGVAIGAGSAALGGTASLLGAKSLGGALSGFGAAGIAVGGGALLGDYLTSPDMSTEKKLPFGRPARTEHEALLSGEIPTIADPSEGYVDWSNFRDDVASDSQVIMQTNNPARQDVKVENTIQVQTKIDGREIKSVVTDVIEEREAIQYENFDNTVSR